MAIRYVGAIEVENGVITELKSWTGLISHGPKILFSRISSSDHDFVMDALKNLVSAWTKKQLRRITEEQERTPILLEECDFYYEGRQYWLHRGEIHLADELYTAEEVKLVIWDKKERQRRKFERLRKQMEAAGNLDEARRERIPEDVRTFVWRRDGGRCVKCGSTENLEFDHIIPVSKGGSSTAKNVQLLCAECNRKKSDHI